MAQTFFKPGDVCVIRKYQPTTYVRLIRMAFGNENSHPPNQWWGHYCNRDGMVSYTEIERWWLESELEKIS